MRSMMNDALSARLLRVAPDGVPLNVTWAPRSRTLCLTGMALSPVSHFRFRKRALWLIAEASTALFAGDGPLLSMSLMNSSVASTAMLKVSSMSPASLSGLLSPMLINMRSSAKVRGVMLVRCMYKIHGLVMSARTIIEHGQPWVDGTSPLVWGASALRKHVDDLRVPQNL